jgi:hypothetical protein
VYSVYFPVQPAQLIDSCAMLVASLELCILPVRAIDRCGIQLADISSLILAS